MNSTGSTPRIVISGDLDSGIEIVFGESHRIVGSFIGLSASGLDAPLPNGRHDIAIRGGDFDDIGSPSSDAAANWIVGNNQAGVFITGPASNVSAPQAVRIVRNRIFANAGLDIDRAVHGVVGVTPNEPLDADEGPNSLVNFPVALEAEWVGNPGVTTLRARIEAEPSTTYAVDCCNPFACHPSGHGGSGEFIGPAAATTNAAVSAQATLGVPTRLERGFSTATASRSSDLAPSEYSACAIGDRLLTNGFER